ncbi:pyridoxine 5'-phosphate synthase [Rhizosaccharibacter radicis]|uniref:Pyridoxine 5'-phosphate synthase n=1 Tax=Rhizosaccharibacter radicis TaxID=2782605 RepID=A0ABT1VZX2_9PROT|nr:pyridoxine 5'-phosphate synthase [Acetobacteraceae bacterium KSS12]
MNASPFASAGPPCRLGLNVDHVATVRNARGGREPDPVAAALLAVAHGVDGITLHLREDRRHIRDDDLRRMGEALGGRAPINLEMAATPEMVEIARAARPHAVCLVPERRAELTTEGGLDVAGHRDTLGPVVRSLGEAGIRVSLFIDPDPAQIRAAAALGAPVVELHTGRYAEQHPDEIARLREGASLAASLALEVHAGHGLDFDNVTAVAAIPEIRELNIGHFLIGRAILDGLPAVIARMRGLIADARAAGR